MEEAIDQDYLDWLCSDFEESAYWKHLGIRMVHLAEGGAKIKMPIVPSLMNCNDVVHGGALTSLLDSIMGVTIRSFRRSRVATIYLNTHYVAPVKEGVLYASAHVINPGKRIVPVQAQVTNQEGRLIATATGAFSVQNEEMKED